MNIGSWNNILKENAINNNKTLGNSLEKLSTGLRINKASDDASGLAISDKLRTQATGIKQGIDNANTAISMMNIADKAIGELSNILDIIKAKAIQMNTDTTSQEGRVTLKTEILKLIDSYDDIVCKTNYNQTPLLNGCATPFDFQVGDNASDIISVNVDSLEARKMGEADPYKLKNFITGFNGIPTPVEPTPVPEPTPVIPVEVVTPVVETPVVPVEETNLNDILTSEIPGLQNFDWNSATKDADGNYVIEDFNSSLVGNQVMDLSGNTYTLLTIDSNYIKNIEFTFNNFDWPSERFTLKDGSTIIGEISTGGVLDGIENVVTPLDTSYVDSWDYSNLESTSLGTVKLSGINKDVSVFATGAFLKLTKMVITLQDNLPTTSVPVTPSTPTVPITPTVPETPIAPVVPTPTTPTTPTCACDLENYDRNDDSPTLVIQARNLMKVIDEALTQLNTQRANVGAGTNQLEATARDHMTGYVNMKNAESVLRDIDYSTESASFNKANIIAQSGAYVQSQANNIDKQYVGQLLK